MNYITALVESEVEGLSAGQLESWLDIIHVQLEKLVHALCQVASLHKNLQQNANFCGGKE
jgi:hypothetical protein